MHQDMGDERPATIDWKCDTCGKFSRVYGPAFPECRVCDHCGAPDPLHAPPPEPEAPAWHFAPTRLAYFRHLQATGRLQPHGEGAYLYAWSQMALCWGADGSSYYVGRTGLSYKTTFIEPGKAVYESARSRLTLTRRPQTT